LSRDIGYIQSSCVVWNLMWAQRSEFIFYNRILPVTICARKYDSANISDTKYYFA